MADSQRLSRQCIDRRPESISWQLIAFSAISLNRRVPGGVPSIPSSEFLNTFIEGVVMSSTTSQKISNPKSKCLSANTSIMFPKRLKRYSSIIIAPSSLSTTLDILSLKRTRATFVE